MSTQTTTATTTEAQTTTAPKDDFVLASDGGKSEVTEPTEEIQKVETAATSEVVETEEVETEESENEETELEASKKEDEPLKKKKGGFQRRVDKLTREKEELKRDNDFWKAKALAADKPAGDVDAKKVVAADSSKKPDSKDFETHEQFTEALADWKYEQKRAVEKAQEREAQVRKDMAAQKDTHINRIKEFEKAHPDFEDAMESIRNVNAHNDIHAAIMNSDIGPAIMYELAGKPEEFAKIVAMDPVAAVKAIGKLEAKLEATSSAGKITEAATKVVEKKVTSAPKPISTINSKAGHQASTRDELPYDQWVKIRNAELRNG